MTLALTPTPPTTYPDALAYPQRGRKLSTRRTRVDAAGFATEVDAGCAIMEHAESNPEDHCSMREYRGEGFFVFVLPKDDAAPPCWLAYHPQH